MHGHGLPLVVHWQALPVAAAARATVSCGGPLAVDGHLVPSVIPLPNILLSEIATITNFLVSEKHISTSWP